MLINMKLWHLKSSPKYFNRDDDGIWICFEGKSYTIYMKNLFNIYISCVCHKCKAFINLNYQWSWCSVPYSVVMLVSIIIIDGVNMIVSLSNYLQLSHYKCSDNNWWTSQCLTKMMRICIVLAIIFSSGNHLNNIKQYWTDRLS